MTRGLPLSCDYFVSVTVSVVLPIKLTFKFLLDLDIPKLNASSQQTIKEDSSFAISCASVGSPSAIYEWISESGERASTSAILSFASVKRAHIGYYFCRATNAFGSKVSVHFNLNVQCMYQYYYHLQLKRSKLVKAVSDNVFDGL